MATNAASAQGAVSANKAELIAIADAVAREKLIDKAIVIEAMEDAIQRAARARYGAEKLQKGAAVGDFIVDPLPPIEFGRIAAQAAKQVIFQKVRDAERERQYEEFKDRVGEIITGVVKRVEFGHVVVDLGRAEGVIRRDQQIPREMVRVGDRIRSLIMAERPDTKQLVIEDCATISRRLSDLLDEVDPIEEAYRLEVSSPGIDRPLTRLHDFMEWAGHEAKISTTEIVSGRKSFRGSLNGVEGDDIQFHDNKAGDVAIPFALVGDAKLILTDALISASMPLSSDGADGSKPKSKGSRPWPTPFPPTRPSCSPSRTASPPKR